MTKTRVPKGEEYWHIGQWGDILMTSEEDSPIDDWLFQCGNYFRTKDEAEAMAKKLRAVLKGADVIEMPSEEEKIGTLGTKRRITPLKKHWN